MKRSEGINIGNNIQQIRRSNGYTQERLAEAIEVSSRYISDIEQDRAKPSYAVLLKICNEFNVGLDQIFSEYLNIRDNKILEYPIAGYDKLSTEDKKTIKYLITYFNKK